MCRVCTTWASRSNCNLSSFAQTPKAHPASNEGMIVYLSLLVCIVGALIFAISANAKASALGKDMFWTGLLAFLLTVGSGHIITLPH